MFTHKSVIEKFSTWKNEKKNHDFNLAQSFEKHSTFYLFCASDYFNGDINCKTENTENK